MATLTAARSAEISTSERSPPDNNTTDDTAKGGRSLAGRPFASGEGVRGVYMVDDDFERRRRIMLRLRAGAELLQRGQELLTPL